MMTPARCIPSKASERAATVDVALYRTIEHPAGLRGYVIPAGEIKRGLRAGFVDTENGTWLRSVGRHKTTGEYHGSTNPVHLEHPMYDCVWLA